MTARPGGGSVFVVLLVGFLWGLNWPAVKFMLTEIPPITIRAIALPLAALVLASVARALGHRLKPARGEIAPIIVTGLLMVGGFNILTSLGQMVTETSKAAIIAYTMPALTAGLAAGFLKERLGAKLIAALLVGMGGLAVLASESFGALAAAPEGPAIMLAAALSWSLGNVALKSRSWSLSPMALTVWFLGASAVVCVALALIFEAPWRMETPSAPVLWTMAYHVMGPMVVCYALWNVLLGRLPATVAAISILTAPVVGVVSAIALLGDPPTWQKAVALAMVIASILMTLIRHPERAK
ncbi:MAG: DMT family transporter [Paracoccaceae bacterium]